MIMGKEEKNPKMLNPNDDFMRFMMDGIVLPIEVYWIQQAKPYTGRIAQDVVLLVPVYNSIRLLKVWTAAIERLNPMPEKVIFCENNSTDETLKFISEWSFPHEIIRVWFKSDAAEDNHFEPIGHVRDLLLTRARRLNIKMAIFIDDDILPESQDFIQQFLSNNLDICGGDYLRPFPEGLFIASKWDPDDVPIKEMPFVPLEFIKKSRKQKKYIAVSPNIVNDRIYKVTMTSAGALALSPKLIQDRRMAFVPIRHDLSLDHITSEDFGFCLLAKTLGYRVYLDMRIKFSHMVRMDKKRPWLVTKDNSHIPFLF